MSNIKRLRLLGIVVGVLILSVIVVLILTSMGSDNNKEDKSTVEESTTSDSKDETKEPVVEVLAPISSENDVYKLILSYIDAAYVKCDIEALKAIMDSSENIDVTKNEARQRYIESYDNVQCYVLDGTDNVNVVFVSYEAKLYNYDVMLPSGEAFVVVKDDDGIYKVHNLEVGEQFESHMTNAEQVAELANIQEKIQSEYNAVIASNSEIKSIVDILNGTNNEQKKVE